MVSLIVFSFYFILNEVKQLITSGFSYLLQVWNYLDLIPPLIIVTVVAFTVFN